MKFPGFEYFKARRIDVLMIHSFICKNLNQEVTTDMLFAPNFSSTTRKTIASGREQSRGLQGGPGYQATVRAVSPTSVLSIALIVKFGFSKPATIHITGFSALLNCRLQAEKTFLFKTVSSLPTF